MAKSKHALTLAFLVALLLCNTAGSHAQKKKPISPLDSNTATAEQLQQLPGIGPVTARAIVRFREKSGPFPEDLPAIQDISKARLDKLRPYITVVPPARKSR